jgi:hypothetical protein
MHLQSVACVYVEMSRATLRAERGELLPCPRTIRGCETKLHLHPFSEGWPHSGAQLQLSVKKGGSKNHYRSTIIAKIRNNTEALMFDIIHLLHYYYAITTISKNL